ARDRNYEFWGDQTFYGENPPQAAVISWINKRQVGDVKLKITDAAGRDVREISGTVLANRNKPGIQSACWDLRVQPVAAPPQAGRAGRLRAEGASASLAGARGDQERAEAGRAGRAGGEEGRGGEAGGTARDGGAGQT